MSIKIINIEIKTIPFQAHHKVEIDFKVKNQQEIGESPFKKYFL